MSRSHAGRKNFRVDSLLKIVEARNKVQALLPVMTPGFMVLTFLGFSNADGVFLVFRFILQITEFSIWDRKKEEV